MQLVRHATLIIQINSKRILVDPMLCTAGEMPPIANSSNDQRNPLVDLPFPFEKLFPVDAVVVTHLHRDHFDHTALEVIPRNTTILCQPIDEPELKEFGFHQVIKVENDVQWEGCKIIRTSGRHGTGEIRKRMGLVSGFIFSVESEPRLYIVGDSIYCTEVEQALDAHDPYIVVVNAGAAQFTTGTPITMTSQDVLSVCERSKAPHIVAVHMEAINHCLETRTQLYNLAREHGYNARIRIPANGEIMAF